MKCSIKLFKLGHMCLLQTINELVEFAYQRCLKVEKTMGVIAYTHLLLRDHLRTHY